MKIKSFVLFFSLLFFLVIFIFLNSVNSSGEELDIVAVMPELSNSGFGGAAVPVSEIILGQDNSFNMKPGRLKFEFNGNWYGLQYKGVRKEGPTFIILDLEDGLNNYVDDEQIALSFILDEGNTYEIDLDKDGKEDITVELKGITADADSISSAEFSIIK
ncbi:MAG: hypothetical protein AABX23_04430 [Nanoarchaeota archaeon]